MRLREVYFARCLSPWGTPMGAIKIGCSYGHDLRLRAIENNQPYSLELITTVPGEMVTEAAVHLYLAKHRIGGEFFHENAYVAEYVEGVRERGTAFNQIDVSAQADYLAYGAFDAFLQYHGLTLERVCRYLGRDPKGVKDVGGVSNRKYIAAALLLARWEGEYGRHVSWPTDCVRGLLGETHPDALPLIEAPPAELEAA